jgi:two-component system response regulator GlrR
VLPLEALPDRIAQRTVPSAASAAAVFAGPYHEAKQQFERSYLSQLLKDAKGNMAQAARVAQIDRSQFFRMVKRLGLNPAHFA